MNKQLKFHVKFKNSILQGIKKSTIRKNNYQNIQEKDEVDFLFWGKVLKSVKIRKIKQIQISEKDEVKIDNITLQESELDCLSEIEGFDNKEDFIKSIRTYIGVGHFDGILFIW